MPIIETLFQLTERDTSNVSGLWKVLQIIGYTVASVTAFVATVSFYNILSGFSMNCVLRTEVQFKKLKEDDRNYNEMISNGTNVTIDSLTTIWNRDLVCQYCLLVWTFSFIGGIILGVFFILNPGGGKGYSHSIFAQPWKMVIPVLLVSVLMVGLTSIASINVVGGINEFCAAFANYTGNASCSNKINVYTLKFHDEIQPIYRLQITLKGASVMVFIAWTSCVALLLVRLCLAPDFNLQIINMIPYERRYSGSQKRTMYSKPSDGVLPLFPINRIENLPVPTESKENFDESTDVNKSHDNQRSQSNKNDNNHDNSSPPDNNGNDTGSPPPPNTDNDPKSDFKTALFKML